MALVAADLLEPLGPLTAALFPEDTVSGSGVGTVTYRLNAYLTDGYTRAGSLTGDDADAAARLWAMYRAYVAVTTRLANEAATVSLADQGARTRTDAQRELFQQMADATLAEFRLLVPSDALTPEPTGYPVINSLRRARRT